MPLIHASILQAELEPQHRQTAASTFISVMKDEKSKEVRVRLDLLSIPSPIDVLVKMMSNASLEQRSDSDVLLASVSRWHMPFETVASRRIQHNKPRFLVREN